MKKAIVVGASSGIGRALSRLLAAEQYAVGLMARRKPLLDELQAELGPAARVRATDVAVPDAAMHDLRAMIEEMGGADLIVICAGVGYLNAALDWEQERETIDVNVLGFCALTNVAMHHFNQRGAGHLVNISSISALRGGRHAPAYNASKAFESSYMEALRGRNAHEPADICITDIQPGFVDTPMAKGDGQFWVASPEEAARQIYQAIRRRRNHAYVTRRWRLIAWLFKCLPNALYDRI